MSFAPLTFILSFTVALVLHELGHLLAARLCGVPVTAVGLGWGPRICQTNINNIQYQLRLLPIGAFVRMDMRTLQRRPIDRQLTILGAGIAVNLILALVSWGSLFGVLNLALAMANLIPLYQQDGWKGAIVIARRILGKKSGPVEWSITVFGGLIALAIVVKAIITLG
jgi:membrane-associated protease RseP (regulator of RpoE activity)